MTSEVTDREEAEQVRDYLANANARPIVTVGHTKFYRVTPMVKLILEFHALRVGYYQDCNGFYLHHTSRSDVAREVSALLQGV